MTRPPPPRADGGSESPSGPSVSVLIPCRDAAPWLDAALRSCIRQRYAPLEIVVVDDGSTDGSTDIVRRVAATAPLPIRLERLGGVGPAAARNRAFAARCGQLIQWLDADDVLLPGKMVRQAALLERTGAHVVVGGWKLWVENEAGAYVEGPCRTPALQSDMVAAAIGIDGWAPNSAYLMRREVVQGVGGWNERLLCIEDVEFWTRVAESGARFVLDPVASVLYRRPRCPTQSTRDDGLFRQGCLEVYESVLRRSDPRSLTPARRAALVAGYGWLARSYFAHDRARFEHCYQRLQQLEPGYVPGHPRTLKWLARLVGYRAAEHAALWYRRAKRLFGPVGAGVGRVAGDGHAGAAEHDGISRTARVN